MNDTSDDDSTAGTVQTGAATSERADPGLNQLMVRFPATQGFLRICRLNTSAFAANLGFDVDALDDLRLAVGEAVAWLLSDRTGPGTITMTLDELHDADGRTGVRLTAERVDPNGPVTIDGPGDLAHAILGATVDEYRLQTSPQGSGLVTLHKFVSGGPE